MRNKVVTKAILPILGLSLALGSSLVLASKGKKAEQAEGYSVSSLPTTIDLNDISAANIRSYYSSLNNLSQSERQGTNLLKNLKTILKNGQKYYAYDSSGDNIWKMYEITDRDWSKSPASSISGYNSSTNKITGYSYNSTDPYIHALYINRDVANQTKAWADHQQTQWGINREHVWPKAEGFDSSGAGGARGDPMHLMAGNGYANNQHSNLFYGYVLSSGATDCGSKYSNLSGNLKGTSKTLNSGTVFEPQDSDKGDIARAIFYMVARYNYLSGSDSDGINSNNPNLTLTQSLGDWASNGYTSTTTVPGKMGIMTDLLAWHKADPVDEFEIHRNNLLYTNFTNNRNPFIDFPEWAEFIWGSVNYNGSTYVSNDTKPTGYATPSSDTINGYNSGGSSDPVSVTGVSLNVNSTSITVGSSEVLSATVSPSNATNKAVSWTSSNNNVATVSSSGRVEGIAEGNATITVTTSDGSFTATCTVTVTASSGGGGGGVSETSYVKITSLSDLDSGDYVIAADLSSSYKGMSYTFSSSKYSGTNLTVSNNVVSSTDGDARKFTLSVTGTGDSRSVTIKDLNAKKYVGYSSSTNLSQLDNAYTWTVSLGGIKGTFRFSSQTSERGLIFRANTYNVYGGYSTGNVTAGGSEYYDLELFKYTEVQSEKSLDSITLDTSDAPTTFNVGDTFSYEGLSVTANYDDGTDDIVTPTSVSTPNLSTAGQKTVTVSYTEGGVTKTATYTVTVNAVTLSSIEVSGAKTAYYVGDTFVKPTVTATYSNGSTSDVTNSATFSGYNLSNAGNQTVTVSYTNGTTVNTSYSITVTALAVTSIAVSGQTTQFNVGDTFAFGGTVTATYNNGSNADVTASASFSGYNMSTAGNYTITVSYTYSGTTKTAQYQITVNASGGGGGESGSFSGTYNYGNQGTGTGKTWSLTDCSDQSSYWLCPSSGDTSVALIPGIFSGKTITSNVVITINSGTYGSGGNPSSSTFAIYTSSACTSQVTATQTGTLPTSKTYTDAIYTVSLANSSGFSDDLAIKITKPGKQIRLVSIDVEFDYETSGSVSPTLTSISLNTDNVQTEFTVGAAFTYSGLIVTAHYSDSTSATVAPTSVSTPDLSSTGNKSVTVTYEENGVSKTTSYQITVNATPSISWTAPTVDVYTGSTLSGSDVNEWAVTYNDGAGHQTVLTYSQITVKLGGTTISIPHTWVAADDGKTLTATYNDLTTTDSSAIRVTQSVNSITAAIKENYDYTFESKQFSAAGSVELGGKSWTMSGTDDGSPYFGYDGTKGQQFGSGSHPFSDISLQSSAFSGTVDSVIVYTSGASSIDATVQVSVGGTPYGSAQSITSNNTSYTFDLGGKSGTISINYLNSSSKAIYIKEIVVNTTREGTNIANNTSHIEAQRLAVLFAKTFNEFMDDTQNCTTGLDAAWSSCSTAYTLFKSSAASLGETEETWCLNLIKYATAQYSDDSGEACIERMMKTYEVCVQKHGKTAFMSDLVTVGSNTVSPLVNVVGDNKAAIIIVIVSLISASTITGYFFIKRRKPE